MGFKPDPKIEAVVAEVEKLADKHGLNATIKGVGRWHRRETEKRKNKKKIAELEREIERLK